MKSIASLTFTLLLTVTLFSCTQRRDSLPELWADSLYRKAGDKISQATFDTLRNSLLDALSKHGAEGAIDLCHTSVISLTNQFADSVTVKRASPRYRNVANRPDSLELYIFKKMKTEIEASGDVQPVVIRDEKNHLVHYFKPIRMQALCINCHGQPQVDIQPATLIAIREKYPDDRAFNFREGELRGIWHILFKPVSVRK